VERRPSIAIVAACILLGLCLAACNRNAPAPSKEERKEALGRSDETTPVHARPSDKRPVIVAFGDSLTAGVAGKSYPEYLQDMLDEHGYAYRVDNQGVSGDTTTDGLARIDNVIDERPALVILEFGGNDGLRGIPVEATRKNLDEMISRLKAAKIPLVLVGITLPPNYGPEYVKPFTAMFPELARKYKLPLLPFMLIHVYQDSALMQPDGIHPNGVGNKIVTRDIFNLIRPLLGNPRRGGK
jgi:acyl-CoA thioesterase-1